MPTGKIDHVTGTPATPKFARLVLMGTVVASNGTTIPDRNIIDLATQIPLPGGDMPTLITNFLSGFQTDFLAVKSDSYTLDAVVGQFIDDPTSAKTVQSVAAAGVITTDRSPMVNAAVIQKLSGLTGKSWRGSMHIGALPESFTTKDQLNAGTGLPAYDNLLGDLNGYVSTGISDGAAAWYPIVISSINSDLVSVPSVITGAWITSFTVNKKIGTMKRRKERGIAA